VGNLSFYKYKDDCGFVSKKERCVTCGLHFEVRFWVSGPSVLSGRYAHCAYCTR